MTIGHEYILEALYDRVVIPEAVEAELLAGHVNIPSFIQVAAVHETRSLQQRRLRVDEGEACAITLAEQLHADLLLIDEKRGRALAGEAGLNYIGLVGLLIEAKQKCLIPELKGVLTRLSAEAGFYLSPSLLGEVFKSVCE